MAFETFTPQRWARSAPGPYVRLSHPMNRAARTGRNCVLRLTRPALDLLGISPQKGDHHYFIVEVDRQSGALRLTRTENPALGRLMNPRNRQINLASAFAEWTGWGESRWAVESPLPGVLLGEVREEVAS